LDTPVFSTEAKPPQPTANEDDYDDGFIYEDNEAGSEVSATFNRNDQNLN